MSKLKQFLQDSEKKAFDLEHRKTIQFNIGKYSSAVQQGMLQYQDHELARQRASFIKTNVINNLDKYLMEFESNFTARGGKVIWAKDAAEALKEVGAIMKRKRARVVVKSKSMITEEIHLNEFLEKNGIETVETDLGEYIVQLAEQRPYHIVTPAMHMSKKDIADLFVKKLHIQPTEDAQQLVLTARRLLREKYTQAEVGITGANFLIADVGGVAITENEGNGRLSTTFPKTHIAIVGIEKLIPSLLDLDLFWPLLSTSGTGQKTTVYNTVLTGPRQPREKDGPEEMYVVLLDNGRTNLLAQPDKREALNCIRCGACLNICPVYKNIGGHSYETTYSGPIGSVITPHLEGMAENKHLSYASSLCGACTSVCPVKIPIHNLLLLNRKQAVAEGFVDSSEKTGFKFWAKAMKHRKLMNLVPAFGKNIALKMVQKDTWSKRREPLQVAPKSFNQLWKERRGDTYEKVKLPSV
ncbi:MAG: LutB/LldF family L-lactate oxidation iron-sulfur protein [Hymenobacteraceae bacterium]|nr:LutB/LldF family L-lactate oxidation iron-sulfur protein [Hymenobacteraceae bacterium]MDX5396370.1 LutB/LldF family L-lactate oxidation iron-sulfur protein [Hymenobacteraceae bacterium]MDX5512430.1 LutB/LldF family L-lactate oxidation iron-sulfur protein [Hymenobacteraceae bacterium]